MEEGERSRLLAAWRRLGGQERESLLLFAEFLASRAQALEEAPPVPLDPLPIPRPERESAVAGLKRLKKSYPMIEADTALLGDASQILMAKVTGATDAEVVTRLEALFAERWRTWRAGRVS